MPNNIISFEKMLITYEKTFIFYHEKHKKSPKKSGGNPYFFGFVGGVVQNSNAMFVLLLLTSPALSCH